MNSMNHLMSVRCNFYPASGFDHSIAYTFIYLVYDNSIHPEVFGFITLSTPSSTLSLYKRLQADILTPSPKFLSKYTGPKLQIHYGVGIIEGSKTLFIGSVSYSVLHSHLIAALIQKGISGLDKVTICELDFL